jgi:hypothetical protein
MYGHTDLFGFDQCRQYAECGDDSNTKCVIIIPVDGPEKDTGNLKDVKRVDNLWKK